MINRRSDVQRPQLLRELSKHGLRTHGAPRSRRQACFARRSERSAGGRGHDDKVGSPAGLLKPAPCSEGEMHDTSSRNHERTNQGMQKAPCPM